MTHDNETVSLNQNELQKLVAEFAGKLQNGNSAKIEAYLTRSGFTDSLLEAFLSRLVQAEVAHHIRRGENVHIADYERRFPAHAQVITSAFQQEMMNTEVVQEDTQPVANHSSPNRQAGSVGKYRLIRELGRGAYGMVFEAHDDQLDRRVALKLLHDRRLSGSDAIERFMREAKAAGQLRHPNIVPVFEAGQEAGNHYIACAMINGDTLQTVIANRNAAGKSLPIREAAQLVSQLAEALHHAHSHGVIHRDVKPGNIMVDSTGEPLIMDFGLARREAPDALQTQQGVIMGTPAYMSPEQARGEAHAADARTDLWSLGVILHELLSGARPFNADTPTNLLHEIIGSEPIGPRTVNRSIPVDLETIVLKCLEKEPANRYASCQHLADELNRWLQGEAILARPRGAAERVLLWCKRRPLIASASALSVLMAVAFLIYWNTRPAYVELHVSPADAKVTVDGEPVALTNGDGLLTYSPGRHIVKVTQNGFLPQTAEFITARGRNNAARVAIDLPSAFGHLQIESEPTDSKVEILNAEGKTVASGRTAYYSPELRQGEYRVIVTRPLHEPREFLAQAPSNRRTFRTPKAILLMRGDARSHFNFARYSKRIYTTTGEKWKFEKTPLDQALQSIAKSQNVEFEIDEAALRDANIPIDVPVTYLWSSESTLHISLLHLLNPVGLSYAPTTLDADNYRFTVTTSKAARHKQFNIVHPIPENEIDDDQQIADEITSRFSIEAWDDAGGPGWIAADTKRHELTVSNSIDVHLGLAHLLANRRTLEEFMGLTARFPAPKPVGPAPKKEVQPPSLAIRKAMANCIGEAAHRFAIAHKIPSGGFSDLCDQALKEGYSLTRVRPWLHEGKVWVAAIWDRNSKTSKHLFNSTEDELFANNEKLRQEGFYPIDVSYYLTNGNLQTAAVWRKSPAGKRNEMARYTVKDIDWETEVARFGGGVVANTRVIDDHGAPRSCLLWALNKFTTESWFTKFSTLEDYAAESNRSALQVDVNTYYRGETLFFATTWAKVEINSVATTRFTDISLKQHLAEIDGCIEKKLAPQSITVYKSERDEPRVAAIWRPGE